MYNVGVYGLGPIGLGVADEILKRRNLKLVGVYDINPSFVGKDLGDLLSIEKQDIFVEHPDYSNFKGIDCMFHTTQSNLLIVEPQLERILQAGCNIVSSTEELSYPFVNPSSEYIHNILTLDQLATKNKASILGTGVNPGFLMDRLPLLLSAPLTDIKRVYVKRMVDASKRRQPLQKKVGAGLSLDEFQKLKSKNNIGHIGLKESLMMLWIGFGFGKIEDSEHILDPVTTASPIKTDYFSVKSGEVAGIHEIISAQNKENDITLDLQMDLKPKEEYDEVVFYGPNGLLLHNKIIGGVFGDSATVNILINFAEDVIKAEPGLKTSLDFTPCKYKK